jgi:hypothetical protein
MIKSGSYNDLSTILENDNLFIIPDLQRDYCWGNIKPEGKNKTLSHIFCSEFIETAKRSDPNVKSELSYGIIYTYEYPETFYYLSDGQQRLSTLYLIIGVLNSYLNDDRLKKLLVSENSQPRLKYEVRTSTDYFINDLVQHVFLFNESKVLGNLKKANWFREDFNYDPSVNSMVEAIKSIHSIIKKSEATLLADFITQYIGFVCVNLKTNDKLEDDSYTKVREYGEKMYEIVNTSGDPMESNEHEKVRLLSMLDESKKEEWTEKWEIWQDFFWQHKAENHESADEGFNEFLEWVATIIGRKKISDSLEKLEITEDIFKGFYLWSNMQDGLNNHRDTHVFNINESLHIKDPSKLVVILPVLQYLKGTNSVIFNGNKYLIDKNSINLELLFRFIRFFTNTSKNTEAGELAANMVSHLKPNDDIVKLLNLKSSDYSLILTDEEVYKLSLYKQLENLERSSIEDAFWAAEDNNFLNGKIDPILNWMDVTYNKSSIDLFSIDDFKTLFSTFMSLFDSNKKIEKVRLCMLSLSENWDIYREGYSWGRSRYYLGKQNDVKYWREKITLPIFKIIILNEKDEKLTNKFINESIMNLENDMQKKIIRKIRSEAPNYWQWNNNKRFFIVDNSIYFPNGVQAKSYTEKIDI